MLLALSALLHFAVCDILFKLFFKKFFVFSLNVLGANVVHILEMNFASCTVSLLTKLANQQILECATIDTFAVISQARIKSSCPQTNFSSLTTEIKRQLGHLLVDD